MLDIRSIFAAVLIIASINVYYSSESESLIVIIGLSSMEDRNGVHFGNRNETES